MHRDKLKTDPANKEYIDGWNRIFNKKEEVVKPKKKTAKKKPAKK